MRTNLYRAWPVLFVLALVLLIAGLWWWNVRLTSQERKLVGIWTYRIRETDAPDSPQSQRYVELRRDRSVRVYHETSGTFKVTEHDKHFSWSARDGHLQFWNASDNFRARLYHGSWIEEEFPLRSIDGDTIKLRFGIQGDMEWHRLESWPQGARN